ncbi:MAG: hypothetical protein AAGK97_03770 [Bacteroidota bacterium]
MIVSLGYSQSFSALSPALKWQQINTEKAKIIFPVGMEEEAQRVANTLDYLYKHETSDVTDKVLRIKVVLIDQGAISNGSVGSAPFKSDFLLSPPRDHYRLGTVNWTDLLSLHEYRHVLQRSHSRKGATAIGYTLLGELTWSGMANLAIPNWFREGDAVIAETMQSNQGRGRNPAFMDEYRHYFINNELPSYNRARNGSIKDLVPDHYRLGYLMTTFGRDKYGDDFWKDILGDAGAYKGVIFPFAKSLKKKTGMSVPEFYKASMDFHEEKVASLGKNSKEKITYLSPLKSGYQSYNNPIVHKGKVYSAKFSFDQLTRIVEHLPNGEEKLLIKTPIIQDNFFSMHGDLIAWAESRVDERWSEENYSVIMLYNGQSKKRTKLSSRTKYFQPSFSNDGNKIICTEILARESNLKVIDINDGSVQSINAPKEYIYTYPRWDIDNTIIVCAREKTGAIGLLRLSQSGELIETLLPMSNEIIGNPSITENYISITAAYGGMIHIYQYNRATKQWHKVSNHNQSLYNPVFDETKNMFYASEFDLNGNRIASIESSSKKMDVYTPKVIPSFERSILNKIPDDKYEIRKYSKFAHFFNLHTWGLNLENIRPELKLNSTNYLNTVDLSAGVFLDNENDLVYNANANIGMFYPLLNINWRTEKESAIVQDSILVKFWDSDISATLSLPLNLSDGRNIRTLTPYAGYTRNSLNITNFDVENISTSAIRGGFIFRNRTYRPRLKLFSNFGQYLRVDYLTDIDDRDATQAQVKTALALPGIHKTHSLIVEADYKNQSGARLSDSFKYARGYGSLLAYESIYRVSADYHFPFAYPDWGLLGFFYFKRLNLDLFADFSGITIGADVNQVDFNSVGVEFTSDIRFANTIDLRMGVRFAYRLDDLSGRPARFEFILPAYRF